jgi:cytochrome c biogenesis protein CcmG, thiol:disulfide interchange protein DsbE
MTRRPVLPFMNMTRVSLRMAMIALIGLALGILAAIAASSRADAKQNQGDRAIDFTLKDLDGKSVKLSSLKGKVVLVDFWASWCVPCKKELPALDAMSAKYAKDKKDVVILTINIDKDRKNAEKFLSSAKIKALRVLLDPDGAVAEQYDLPTMPTSYVIDKKGIVKHVHEGYDAGDEKTVAGEIDALLK